MGTLNAHRSQCASQGAPHWLTPQLPLLPVVLPLTPPPRVRVVLSVRRWRMCSEEGRDGSRRTTSLEQILLNGNNIALLRPGGAPEDETLS